MKLNEINIKSFTVKLLITAQMILICGCKKMLDVDLPVDRITKETVYSNTNIAVSVLNGIYSRMSGDYFVTPNINLGIAADEFKSDFPSYLYIYFNAVPTDDSLYGLSWKSSYLAIYACNSLIEGVSLAKEIVEKDKKTLIAEAKFTRALHYFYLVNTYGGVPLTLTSDFRVNSKLSRSTVDEVYSQVEKDLIEAKADLGSDYLGPNLTTVTTERVRPTRWAATALLARMYLYRLQWQKAETMATEIIQNTALFEPVALDQVFKKNSKETIWALQPINQQGPGLPSNTNEGHFIPPPGVPPGQATLSDNLLSSFEPNDQRKSEWLGLYTDTSVTPAKNYYYPYKYKIGFNYTQAPQPQDEYSIVFRLSEQYLIRAEARAQLTNLEGAKADLDVIRQRAGLDGVTISSKENMLAALLKERQVELFTEGGHRWFDLKRTGKIDEVMSVQTPIKGGNWASYKALFPLPYYDLLTNPALQGHQNPNWPERL